MGRASRDLFPSRGRLCRQKISLPRRPSPADHPGVQAADQVSSWSSPQEPRKAGSALEIPPMLLRPAVDGGDRMDRGGSSLPGFEPGNSITFRKESFRRGWIARVKPRGHDEPRVSCVHCNVRYLREELRFVGGKTTLHLGAMGATGFGESWIPPLNQERPSNDTAKADHGFGLIARFACSRSPR